MSALTANITAGRLLTDAELPPRPLTQRQENFARCVASGMSYAEAFRQAGLVSNTIGGMSRQIQALKRVPGVQARIAELKVLADREIESTFAERASWLRLVVQADPAELSRVVHYPCGHCWPDIEIAAAFKAHFMPTPFHEERPALPDTNKPRQACQHCRGEGVAAVVLTPTDELSPAGRALFKGAKQNEKGVIEIQTHDQAAALDMLNRMHSSYVTRSLNLNANVAVHAARDASPADALKLFEQFGP
jgi:hypothetical protein